MYVVGFGEPQEITAIRVGVIDVKLAGFCLEGGNCDGKLGRHCSTVRHDLAPTKLQQKLGDEPSGIRARQIGRNIGYPSPSPRPCCLACRLRYTFESPGSLIQPGLVATYTPYCMYVAGDLPWYSVRSTNMSTNFLARLDHAPSVISLTIRNSFT